MSVSARRQSRGASAGSPSLAPAVAPAYSALSPSPARSPSRSSGARASGSASGIPAVRPFSAALVTAEKIEDVSDRFKIAPSERLISYPYDRSIYIAEGTQFVTAAEAEAGIMEEEATIYRPLPALTGDTQSAFRVGPHTAGNLGIFPADLSVIDPTARSVLQQRYYEAVSAEGEVRAINFFGVFYLANPDVQLALLETVADETHGFAAYLLDREQGLGNLLFEPMNIHEEASRYAERIELRTVQFNAWLDRIGPLDLPARRAAAGANRQSGVHGLVIVTMNDHVFQISIGPSRVVIVNRLLDLAGITPADAVAVVPEYDPAASWMPQNPRSLRWNASRLQQQERRLVAGVRSGRVDPYPEQSRRFDLPFVPGDDPRRAGQVVIVGAPIAGLSLREQLEQQLSTVFTPVGLWPTLPGDTIGDKVASMEQLIFDASGASTGVPWPPSPMHPSAIFFGAESKPAYGPVSQATPFVMEWELVVQYGAPVPLVAVLGDDQFWDIMGWAAEQAPYAEQIQNYHIEIDDPEVFYRRPNFRLDRARDLAALTVWGAREGEEFNAVRDLVLQAMEYRRSFGPRGRAVEEKAAVDHPNAYVYPWSEEWEQPMPAFMLVTLVRRPASSAPGAALAAEIPGLGPGAAEDFAEAAENIAAGRAPPGARRRTSLHTGMILDRAADGPVI